jgi:hypothetical protein
VVAEGTRVRFPVPSDQSAGLVVMRCRPSGKSELREFYTPTSPPPRILSCRNLEGPFLPLVSSLVP